jgi:hypothetical protein
VRDEVRDCEALSESPAAEALLGPQMVTLLLPPLQPGSPSLMFLFFFFLHHRATLYCSSLFSLSSTTTMTRRQAFEEQPSGKTTGMALQQRRVETRGL